MIDHALKQAEGKMAKAIEVTREEFAGFRTGRASPTLLQKITVDYYGAPTPMQQLASFSVPESRMLVTYTKPDTLRMFPPISFLNDETGATPVLTYLGTTTRITLENQRTAALDVKDFLGQPLEGPSAAPVVKALQLALPSNILPDQVPLDLLAPLAPAALWTGALATNRLEGPRSETT